MVGRLVSWALAALLLGSCSTTRPAAPQLDNVAQNAPHGLVVSHTDSLVQAQLGPPPALPSIALPLVPGGLSPRQQRRWLRVAGKAQARVIAALPAVVPKKVRIDNRGAYGGAYAPKAKAPVAAAGGVATNTYPNPASTPSWGWGLLVAALIYLIWRARSTR